MRRQRVAWLGLILVMLLATVAAFTSIAHRDAGQALRARFQEQSDQAFDGQPARHPHRMVHYGHFVFRPLPALAAFDPGVDAFTGHTVFLEGHRQNSANFGDVRQSSLLVRFGQLTPAFVLQTLAPLLLVFLGFGVVAREREQGTLRLLLAQGVSVQSLLTGKLLAIGGVALLVLLPGALALCWMLGLGGAEWLPSLVLLAGYVVYLAAWTLLIVVVSGLMRHARSALLVLVGLWAVTVVLLPRVATDLALSWHPEPTRFETDIRIAGDLHELGDSHNPDDPHFTGFRSQVLAQYGVSRIEDLPVNFNGLLAIEGERLSAELFDDYAARSAAVQARQSGVVRWVALASPSLALRQLSMAAAGTDLSAHRHFLQQAEAYRFQIVQRLNGLQANALTWSDDVSRNRDPDAGRRVRIDPRHWRDVPDFEYQAIEASERLRGASPGALVLLLWVLMLAAAAALVGRRLGAGR